MDEELERLENMVRALEKKIEGLDKHDISEEDATRLHAELDDAYEQVDASVLTDDMVDDLMDRLDDLQDIVEDLVGDVDWDSDGEHAEEEEESEGGELDDEDD